MPKTLEYVSRCYRILLWLYPAELREAYGADMAGAFEQVLRTEFEKRGSRGAAVTGCRAIGELFTVAIPGWLMSERLLAIGLSLLINLGVLGLLVAIMMWPRYRLL